MRLVSTFFNENVEMQSCTNNSLFKNEKKPFFSLSAQKTFLLNLFNINHQQFHA